MSMISIYFKDGELYMARLSEEGQQTVDDVEKNESMPHSDFWTNLRPVTMWDAIFTLFAMRTKSNPIELEGRYRFGRWVSNPPRRGRRLSR